MRLPTPQQAYCLHSLPTPCSSDLACAGSFRHSLDLSHASLLALSPSRPQRRAGPCLSRVSLELGHFVPLLAHFPFLPRQAVGQERLRGARFNRRGGSEHDVAARLPEVSVGRSDTRLYRVVCRWSCRIFFRAASCNEAPP